MERVIGAVRESGIHTHRGGKESESKRVRERVRDREKEREGETEGEKERMGDNR